MKRFLHLLLLLPILTLSLIGCKDDKVAANSVTTTPIERTKTTHTSNTENEIIVSENNSSNDTVSASEEIDKSVKNVGDSDLTADELVKKAINTKPTAKNVSLPSEEKAKSAVKPVKKAKPNPVKAPPTKYLPKVEFDEMSYDFGEITEGDIIKHNFTFTNTGKTNLSIEKATATCGCTKPSFPFIDIKPGETGYIGVTYNSVNKDGDQKPEITVFSNAIRKEITLSLMGSVKPKPQEEIKEDIDASESMPQDTTRH